MFLLTELLCGLAAHEGAIPPLLHGFAHESRRVVKQAHLWATGTGKKKRQKKQPHDQKHCTWYARRTIYRTLGKNERQQMKSPTRIRKQMGRVILYEREHVRIFF